MPHTHKKSGKRDPETIAPMDCFIESTKRWFWIIIVVMFGAVIYSIVISIGQKAADSTAAASVPQGGQFQTAALTTCPYCPGFLDSQGRCNVRDCPIYSPAWGKPQISNDIPVRIVLIKELALEVGATQGKGSVIIQAVYAGGNAEKAGLRTGDKISRFNGRKVSSVKQFQSVVVRARPELPVEIKVIRNNAKITTNAIIGEGEMAGVTLP
ncbi:MAG: PDZ domain-containing protein [Planctomycetes bacterium]|nr:PDZ domain-containing protein [Planctomycetota bacterium]